jgi:hypothetical protein
MEMNPNSKMDEMVCFDVTAEMQEPEVVASNQKEVGGAIDIADCAREVGGLVLRGNRCVLVRSIVRGQGMRIPSVPLDDESKESPIEGAIRCVSECLEIDGTTELTPLPHVCCNFFKSSHSMPPPPPPASSRSSSRSSSHSSSRSSSRCPPPLRMLDTHIAH